MLQMRTLRINCWEALLLIVLQWGHNKAGWYSTEEIDSIMTQICCSHFGNGLADLAPGSRIGENPVVSGQYLDLRAQI